ncbi:Glycyl-glycine endopeptidase LytM precursor [Streptomyces sp. ADI92-24]|uniref:peptidoglycan DD-metalloendopeptidase family protein n=1 Tax=Streptomyces sp. ADI92-24 TaxID=1522756 RepID=UPI000F558F0A|nr:peptidoglycan DD-metalloendopeptidase family protein [Streptomyces sp. ADI92-24]RPK28907.1 Glycyl-glycine endopeptidase LytM precursor [Streptomyces sp. ADI92-24]
MQTSRRRGAVRALLTGALALGLASVTAATAQAADPATNGASYATARAAADAECSGSVSIYGGLADGRLTYSQIDPSSGDRLKTLVGPDLGFVPKAMATLNFNTVLATDSAGTLYRIDVKTNNLSLALMNSPVPIGTGWTHDKLVYDGHGHLYGTAGGVLFQYLVSQPKPTGSEHIGQRREIGTGFVLKTLASTGDDRLLANTVDGRLVEYRIDSAGAWSSKLLASANWSGFEKLVSPGGGLYYGVTSAGGMYWYQDANPTDGSGSDIVYHNDDPVDTSGWTQILLSAEPETATCVGHNYAYVLPQPAVPRSELDDPHHDYAAIDIPVPIGTPVYAVTRGTVGYIDGGFGNGITLTSADGTTYIYGHLDSRGVAAGTTVTPGQYLGESGNTGQSTGPHLHFEIRIGGVKHCPQPLLLALYDGVTPPAPSSLPTSGCSY